jgi:hypothetical protein
VERVAVDQLFAWNIPGRKVFSPKRPDSNRIRSMNG